MTGQMRAVGQLHIRNRAGDRTDLIRAAAHLIGIEMQAESRTEAIHGGNRHHVRWAVEGMTGTEIAGGMIVGWIVEGTNAGMIEDTIGEMIEAVDMVVVGTIQEDMRGEGIMGTVDTMT